MSSTRSDCISSSRHKFMHGFAVMRYSLKADYIHALRDDMPSHVGLDNKKEPLQAKVLFCWWGEMDSNHRS